MTSNTLVVENMEVLIATPFSHVKKCYLENNSGFAVWARKNNGPHVEGVICWNEHG